MPVHHALTFTEVNLHQASPARAAHAFTGLRCISSAMRGAQHLGAPPEDYVSAGPSDADLDSSWLHRPPLAGISAHAAAAIGGGCGGKDSEGHGRRNCGQNREVQCKHMCSWCSDTELDDGGH